MGFESVTDQTIKELLACPKRVTNPNAHRIRKGLHEQVNYTVSASDGSGHRFQVYLRQNCAPGMHQDFSCGISWLAANGETLTLRRYNGPSHQHPNHLEKEVIEESCHIHLATERYIRNNRKPEGFAEKTDRYRTLDGALHCLANDCHLLGIETKADEPNLFTTYLNNDEH